MTDSNPTPNPKSPRPRNTVLETLGTAFPVVRDYKPLAIGIHKVIAERMPELDKAQLRTALKMHTASTRYLKTLCSETVRVDLDGNAAGEITAEQRQAAGDALKERFRKAADRKRAEQQEKERQEKLLKLTEKFAKR
jgi:ProP effector